MASSEMLTKYRCQVVIVSFGERKGAEQWKAQVQCPFPVFLDQTRTLYSNLGMKRSFAKVWSTDSMLFYAGAMIQNRELPKPSQDFEDDVLLMGGDVIFNQGGNPAFIYRSKTPNDRPTIAQVLQFLQEYEDKK